MRKPLAFVALVGAFALATWLGWWAVPAVAAFYGALRPTLRRPAFTAAIAAADAWALWLLVDALQGHGALDRLGVRVGSVVHAPFVVLLLLTLLFPAALAWSASALAGGIAGILDGMRPGAPGS